ncbi:aminotransferase class V-fold PLP-dependent enzyme [Pseudidiomarina taiwanensis]|uniref:Selenocysteine lyase n=1 Tax=Pseudidiomarina taiwanensis TaxID=337250 RepID=A0A432ZKV6_9GAMM|nr:aminotransferase class V-fold PLP-dependent enzyme [Pseudidiomarina taiwanensis]RUO78611.1 selenocysteine lyase [Pseudidiomarina taiwanensis]
MSYKSHYRHFFELHPQQLHCAPHSHHYWPDVTRKAQLEYWDDSAVGVDHKWDKIFGEKVPHVQQRLAQLLNYPAPEQFVFAPNTHELLYRVISAFAQDQPLRILTTDSEFHSFSRQVRRLAERPQVAVTVVATEPFDSFASRWSDALAGAAHDLIFCSQVYFNSGVIAPWVETWLDQVPSDTQIIIDGYHGCGAIETDLSRVADRVFYLAGSYKYLQAGEGCCFMSVPRDCSLRPEYTGWFADFNSLAKPQQGPIDYANDGFRFAGATQDFSALYRLAAVLDWWHQEGLTVAQIHRHVQTQQQAFLAVLDVAQHPVLNRSRLLHNGLAEHGHFYTFELDSAEQVSELAVQLQQAGIATDYRYKRLRFGFALYHDPEDFHVLTQALSKVG